VPIVDADPSSLTLHRALGSCGHHLQRCGDRGCPDRSAHNEV